MNRRFHQLRAQTEDTQALQAACRVMSYITYVSHYTKNRKNSNRLMAHNARRTHSSEIKSSSTSFLHHSDGFSGRIARLVYASWEATVESCCSSIAGRRKKIKKIFVCGCGGPRLVVHRLGGIFSSVGHRVKIHHITPATGKERGDVEIRDYHSMSSSKTPGLDRLISSSAEYTHIRFYFDTYAFWKITVVFSGTVDAHQTDGWCPRA